jgi:hypothetical protein
MARRRELRGFVGPYLRRRNPFRQNLTTQETTMSARSLSLVVLGAALTLGVTACGSTEPKTAPAPTASASPAAEPTTDASGGTGGQGTGDNRAGCPVTEDALMTALKAKYHTLPKGQTLRRIQCHQDYAIASRVTPGFDSDVQTFRYSAGTWRSFTGGSAGYCDGVPAAVKKYFRAHGYQGCA